MTINSKAAIKALAITAVLVAGGVWFGISDLGKRQATIAAAPSSDNSTAAMDAQVAANMKKITDAQAENAADRTPFEVCAQDGISKLTPGLPGGESAIDASCGNLHGASLSAIKGYEEKQHPLPIPNCFDKGPWARRSDPDAQKLWDACMTIQALNNKRAQAGFDADQAKLASEQAMHKKPQDDPNAIIPNL